MNTLGRTTRNFALHAVRCHLDSLQATTWSKWFPRKSAPLLVPGSFSGSISCAETDALCVAGVGGTPAPRGAVPLPSITVLGQNPTETF